MCLLSCLYGDCLGLHQCINVCDCVRLYCDCVVFVCVPGHVCMVIVCLHVCIYVCECV